MTTTITIDNVTVSVKGGTIIDAIEQMERTLSILRKHDPMPYAFYKNRWVSVFNRTVECFFMRQEQYMKEQLREGKTLNDIKDWALKTIDTLWTDIGTKEGKCHEIWGDDWRNKSGMFILCVCILLKLKVIDNDMENGFGYRGSMNLA